jgi:septum formation topological specificity factor MinE
MLLLVQLLQAKQRYASEMDVVKDKLQVVLAKKDGIIAGLRQELQEVTMKFKHAQRVMLDLGKDSEPAFVHQ